MVLIAPYVIIGLGNPGLQYHKSRHNAGFCVIDAFLSLNPAIETKQTSTYTLAKCYINSTVFYLVKPLTYMNLSGSILASLKTKIGFNASQLLVIADNMDLAVGRLRLKEGGGSAGQKGLQDIIEKLGSPQFYRLYVGINRPTPPMDVASYVLGRFNPEQEPLFLQSCNKAARLLSQLPNQPLPQLQQLFNSDVN